MTANPQVSLPLTGANVSIEGAVSIEQTSEGVIAWRLPLAQRHLFEPSLVGKAAMQAGVRLTLVSDTTSLTLRMVAQQVEVEPAWKFDLLVDGALHQRVAPPFDADTINFTDIPAGEHLLELYLTSQYVPLVLRSLSIDRGASAKAWIDDRRRLVVYGSSITHCRHAAGPSEAWPAIVARRFGVHLTCLGYGADCHLDPMVGRMIRDLPADYIGLKIGINMIGGSASDRTFRAMVIGMLETIRDGHPDTPIAVVSPICHPPSETTPNVVGMTLELMRQRLAEACHVMRDHGDANLHYIDGLDLMGPQDVHLYADGTHPNAEGYRFLAEAYGRIVMPKLGLKA
jgi:lysophospholipase L1-like esterase